MLTSAHIPAKVHICEHAQHTPQTTWEMRIIPRFFSNLPGTHGMLINAQIPATVHIHECAHHTYKEAE